MIKIMLMSLTPRINHVSLITEKIKYFSTLWFDNLVGSIISHQELFRDLFTESDKKYLQRMKMPTLILKETK